MDNTSIASAESINAAVSSLTKNSFMPIVVENKEEALAKVLELIPEGASINNGSSTTLEEIGFVDHLKAGEHKWKNLHEEVLKEEDPVRQEELRKQSVISDYYLGSAHAVTENGELVISSASGSQLPGLAHTAQNLVLVVGAQKIVPTLDDAFERVDKQVIPLEDARMKEAYGVGTLHAKTLILRHEHPMAERKAHIVIVKEPLGF